jgi:hypothetical protein
METICKVYQCRYSNTHNTSYHLCGTCKQFGHGQLECNNTIYINQLKQNPDYNKSLNIENYCTINDCKNKETHNILAHHCSFCLGNHSNSECSYNKIKYLMKTVLCPLCRVSNKIYNDTPINLFGVDTNCSICLANACNIILPDCRHVCLCSNCYQQL